MTTDDLRAWGANVDEGLGRCMGMEAVYLRLVGTIPGDAHFGQILQALDAGDLDGIHEASHALKGSTGNLSLTPLFEPLNELCELTRPTNRVDGKDYLALCAPLSATIEDQRAKLATLL